MTLTRCSAVNINDFEQVFTQWFASHLVALENKYLLKVVIGALEIGVKYVQVNNKDARTTSMKSFWCLYC